MKPAKILAGFLSFSDEHYAFGKNQPESTFLLKKPGTCVIIEMNQSGKGDRMISLENKNLSVVINRHGAQLTQIHSQQHQQDYLAEKTPTVLFPAIGKSAAESYHYQDQDYPMPPDGFAKDQDWQVYSQSQTAVTLSLDDNQTTMANYPFHFQFLVTYQLQAAGLHVAYHLTNMDNVEMAFALGAEVACALDLDADLRLHDYQLILQPQRALTLERELDQDQYLTGAIRPNRAFQRGQLSVDQLAQTGRTILTNRDMQSLVLKNKVRQTIFCLSSQDFPFFTVAYDQAATALHLGLWNGLPDKAGQQSELLRKEGNLTLPARDNLAFSYEITLS